MIQIACVGGDDPRDLEAVKKRGLINEGILSCEKVQEMFGVKYNTLYNWNLDGILKYYKIKGTIIYFAADVETRLQEIKGGANLC